MVFTTKAGDKAISGFVAGAGSLFYPNLTVSTAVLHPFDLIKTKAQVNESTNPTFYKLFLQIKREDGVKGLYRGLSANFTGSCLSWGFYFLFYQSIKDHMRAMNNKDPSKVDLELNDSNKDENNSHSNNQQLSSSQHMLSSFLAGSLTCLLTNPIWVVKTRMCTTKSSDPGAYRNVIHGLIETGKNEGLRGLYRGLVPALFGTSHGAIQFVIYERLKQSVNKSKNTEPSILDYTLIAATSKVIATTTTYPYQVIKSRIQNEKKTSNRIYYGIIPTINHIYLNEGIFSFYKGIGPNLLRVLPGTCITFAVYEAMGKLLNTF